MPPSHASEPFPDTTSDDPFAEPSQGANGSSPHQPAAANEPNPKIIEAKFTPRALHPEGELEFYSPETTIVIFNSHAEADAAKSLLPDTVCLGWSGVRLEAGRYNWAPLINRQVLIWPAATHSSGDSSQRVSQLLPDALVIRTPSDWSRPGLPTGLSIADAAQAGFTAAEAQTWLARELERKRTEYEATRTGSSDFDDASRQLSQAAAVTPDPDRAPFRHLGYDAGMHYYLPDETQQIIALEGEKHGKAHLLRIAPRQWWDDQFTSKQGADWTAAGNAMLRCSAGAGLFSTDSIRGRGCWIDDGRVVFHAGDKLVVDRIPIDLSTMRSKFVYQRARPITPELSNHLSSQESAKFQDLCDSLSWTAPLYGRLLAGWCMAAAVCGALHWRPHIWITGPAGSGKSWTVENIVTRFLDRFTLSILSSSTEAGMRQTIRSDALAIVLDEAESEDEKGRSRMKSILDLVRQSSSESGGAIVKGTMSGNAMEYRVRSCFCFSSIGVAAVARADTSRITVLSLHNRAHDSASFERIKQLARETILDDTYAAGLRARAIHLAREIRDNAKIFASVVSKKIGDSRAGDQIGALLAGAFALKSSRMVDIQFATDWVDKQDWSDFMVADADKDEHRSLSMLLSKVIRVDGPTGNPENTSFGHLLEIYHDASSSVSDREWASSELALRGIKPTPQWVDVSCSHPEIAGVFRDGAWAGKWKDQLDRIPGSKKIEAVRFGLATHRAIRLIWPAFGLKPPVVQQSAASTQPAAAAKSDDFF